LQRGAKTKVWAAPHTLNPWRDPGRAHWQAAGSVDRISKGLNPYGKIVIRDLHTGAQFDPQKP